MKVVDFIQHLEKEFPNNLQESFDNSGKQVLFSEEECSGVLLALDFDQDVLNEALNKNIKLIVTHHPFIFNKLAFLEAGDPNSDLIISLIENKISLYAIHTNLDKIFWGKYQNVFNFQKLNVLCIDENASSAYAKKLGFGLGGAFSKPKTLAEVFDLLKVKLKAQLLRYTGNLDQKIETVAFLNGSGSHEIPRLVKNQEYDLIITGDLGYHDFKMAAVYQQALCDAGHYGTEKILVEFLYQELLDFLTKKGLVSQIDLIKTEKEKEPINYYR